MSVKFNVKMTEKYMYDFMLYHNYSHISGLFGAIVGVFALGIGINSVTKGDMPTAALCFLVAFMFLVATPGTMKTKAKQQVKNAETFQKPLEYELTEEGVTVRQEEAENTIAWGDFWKAVSTNNSIILYVTRVRALIFPKECMGDQYEEAVKMIHTHMPPAKVKIRHIH